MIKINLLPPQNKKELEVLNSKDLIISLATWIIIFLVSFSLILATIFIYLNILLRSQNRLIDTKQDDVRVQQLIETEKNIINANRLINLVYDKQAHFLNWTLSMKEISLITPNSIYLTSFDYRSESNEINIVGWSNTRDDLLSFQEILESNDFFTDVKSPIANLLKRENINFNISLKPDQTVLGNNK
ncbi:MAG: PilN domain-containing protein [bacterium]